MTTPDGGILFDQIRTFIQENVHAITANLVAGYTGDTSNTGDDPTVLNATVAQSINNRLTTLEGGGVLNTYTASGTWTNPTPTAHNLITVICINGGDGGSKPQSGSTNPQARDTPKGGYSGGYVSRQLYTDELPSTVTMTIGTGGAGSTVAATRGATGGTTSFGTYVVGQRGIGAVYKADGSYAVAVPPGKGGDGGFWDGSNIVLASQNGQSGPFAAGGRAGYGYSTADCTGENGADAPSGIPSGGGGGGGGSQGVNATPTQFAGPGGNGGFPGGGGGGGGHAGNTGLNGNGGNGANGCIYVITP